MTSPKGRAACWRTLLTHDSRADAGQKKRREQGVPARAECEEFNPRWLVLLAQRMNVRDQRFDLVLVERVLERGHVVLPVHNLFFDLRVGELLDRVRAQVGRLQRLAGG